MKLSPIATMAVGRAVADVASRRKTIGVRKAIRMAATQADVPLAGQAMRANWHEARQIGTPYGLP
jgi:hypothetical protein